LTFIGLENGKYQFVAADGKKISYSEKTLEMTLAEADYGTVRVEATATTPAEAAYAKYLAAKYAVMGDDSVGKHRAFADALINYLAARGIKAHAEVAPRAPWRFIVVVDSPEKTKAGDPRLYRVGSRIKTRAGSKLVFDTGTFFDADAYHDSENSLYAVSLSDVPTPLDPTTKPLSPGGGPHEGYHWVLNANTETAREASAERMMAESGPLPDDVFDMRLADGRVVAYVHVTTREVASGEMEYTFRNLATGETVKMTRAEFLGTERKFRVHAPPRSDLPIVARIFGNDVHFEDPDMDSTYGLSYVTDEPHAYSKSAQKPLRVAQERLEICLGAAATCTDVYLNSALQDAAAASRQARAQYYTTRTTLEQAIEALRSGKIKPTDIIPGRSNNLDLKFQIPGMDKWISFSRAAIEAPRMTGTDWAHDPGTIAGELEKLLDQLNRDEEALDAKVEKIEALIAKAKEKKGGPSIRYVNFDPVAEKPTVRRIPAARPVLELVEDPDMVENAAINELGVRLVSVTALYNDFSEGELPSGSIVTFSEFDPTTNVFTDRKLTFEGRENDELVFKDAKGAKVKMKQSTFLAKLGGAKDSSVALEPPKTASPVDRAYFEYLNARRESLLKKSSDSNRKLADSIVKVLASRGVKAHVEPSKSNEGHFLIVIDPPRDEDGILITGPGKGKPRLERVALALAAKYSSTRLAFDTANINGGYYNAPRKLMVVPIMDELPRPHEAADKPMGGVSVHEGYHMLSGTSTLDAEVAMEERAIIEESPSEHDRLRMTIDGHPEAVYVVVSNDGEHIALKNEKTGETVKITTWEFFGTPRTGLTVVDARPDIPIRVEIVGNNNAFGEESMREAYGGRYAAEEFHAYRKTVAVRFAQAEELMEECAGKGCNPTVVGRALNSAARSAIHGRDHIRATSKVLEEAIAALKAGKINPKTDIRKIEGASGLDLVLTLPSGKRLRYSSAAINVRKPSGADWSRHPATLAEQFQIILDQAKNDGREIDAAEAKLRAAYAKYETKERAPPAFPDMQPPDRQDVNAMNLLADLFKKRNGAKPKPKPDNGDDRAVIDLSDSTNRRWETKADKMAKNSSEQLPEGFTDGQMSPTELSSRTPAQQFAGADQLALKFNLRGPKCQDCVTAGNGRYAFRVESAKNPKMGRVVRVQWRAQQVQWRAQQGGEAPAFVGEFVGATTPGPTEDVYKAYLGIPPHRLGEHMAEVLKIAEKHGAFGFKLCGLAASCGVKDRFAISFATLEGAKAFSEEMDARLGIYTVSPPPGTAMIGSGHVALARESVIEGVQVPQYVEVAQAETEAEELAAKFCKGSPECIRAARVNRFLAHGLDAFTLMPIARIDEPFRKPVTPMVGGPTVRPPPMVPEAKREPGSNPPPVYPPGTVVHTARGPIWNTKKYPVEVPELTPPPAGDPKDVYFTSNEETYPYMAAGADAKPPGYTYQALDEYVSVSGHAEGTVVEIPELSSDQRMAAKVPVGMNVANNATLVGEGGSADVYVTHEAIPLDLQARIALMPDETSKQNLRKKWAKSHANPIAVKILKLRYGEAYTTARSVSRLEYLYQFAKDMVDHAKVDGRRLVRVAKTYFNATDLARGMFEQEYVEGPTAYELQRAINLLKNPPKLAPFAVSQAQALLNSAGLSVDEAQRMIHCLEQFYRDAHGAALNAQMDRSFAVANGGRSSDPSKSGPSLQVGFDYLHGRNVVWDVKARQFVMVDW
jgi:hypothetical protein